MADAQNGKLAKEDGVLTPNTGSSDSGRKQCDVLLVESYAPLRNCYKQLAPECSEIAKELEGRICRTPAVPDPRPVDRHSWLR